MQFGRGDLSPAADMQPAVVDASSSHVEPAHGEPASRPTGTEPDHRTRNRVCREVLERGPVTAADLGAILGLTPAAVRRHLDGLLAAGLVCVWEAPRGRRGRGRPARRFVVTDAGHAALATAYDDLAAAALHFLADVAGGKAVRRFADARVADIEARYRPVVEAVGPDPALRARALADVLSHDGYAASTRTLLAGPTPIGTQLCQGHCPVQQVAREFPQLCEAETEAFSRLLGVHVQRLATLAHGEHVCTTHIPHAATHIPYSSPVANPARSRAPRGVADQERTAR